MREIKEGLKRSQERDRFRLMPCLDGRPRDIQRALLEDPPDIVHFAGQGVCVERLQCVVLNGCYSEVQADAIAQHIESVIGIRDEISNEAAWSLRSALMMP